MCASGNSPIRIAYEKIVKLSNLEAREVGTEVKKEGRRKIQFVSQILRSRFVVCGEEHKAKIWNFHSAFRSNEMDEPKNFDSTGTHPPP